jgi:hypothetical protein
MVAYSDLNACVSGIYEVGCESPLMRIESHPLFEGYIEFFAYVWRFSQWQNAIRSRKSRT